MVMGRKLYSVKEAYWIFHHGIRTMKYMSRARKKGELNPRFVERIMLAVTEVNDCSLCSHAHTRWALESGMSREEIREILAGKIDHVPDAEVKGVIFAKHYADSRGKPTLKSWERIVEIYGLNLAMGILGSIRTIMIGNIYGLPWSSFFNRFRAKADPRCSLSYELSMMLGTLLAPVAFFHALIDDLRGKPVIDFK